MEERYKLVTYDTRDYGELCDLEGDPLQLPNLFDAAGHRARRAEMMARYLPEGEPPDLVRERQAVA